MCGVSSARSRCDAEPARGMDSDSNEMRGSEERDAVERGEAGTTSEASGSDGGSDSGGGWWWCGGDDCCGGDCIDKGAQLREARLLL